MTRNSIRFSYLWDKLMAPRFTTIRSWNLEKEDYYRSLVGQKFQIRKTQERYPFYREYVVCHAYLESVVKINPAQAPDYSLLEMDVMLNGSVDRDWLAKIMKMEDALLMTFSRSPVPHQSLLEVQ